MSDLNQIITLCMHCPSVKYGKEYKHLGQSAMEQLLEVAKEYNYSISHGLCDKCLDKHYPNPFIGKDLL